jgi:hypothetical protein
MAVTFNQAFGGWERNRDRLSNVISQITLLNNDIARLASSPNPSDSELRAARNTISNIDRNINQSIDSLNALSEQIASSDMTQDQQDQLQELIENTGYQFLDQQQRLRASERSLSDAERRARLLPETPPKNSAGDIVKNEQDGKTEGANVQSPSQGDLTLDDDDDVIDYPTNNNTGTNAIQPKTSNDVTSNSTTAPVGGDAVSKVGGSTPVVTTEQTQKTNPTQTATTAAHEDAYTPPQSTTATSTSRQGQVEVAKEFLEPIVSKPNLLSGLSSMTYGLSLYLLSPDEFAEFSVAENKILPSNQLLMQSAGAPKGERNEWFNVDFYIEDFELESVVGTQAQGSPHNGVSLKFTVVEPQGITFLNRLNNAVIAHVNSQEDGKKVNAYSQTYLMVIRFYGYDGSGNPVTAAQLGLNATTDSDAVIEKFIPFMISNFNYKIQTKATEYNIEGVCHGSNIAFSTQRGVVPFNVQLTASSVDQLFNGNKVLSDSQQATEEGQTNIAQTGNTQTVVQGLVQALNEYQQRLGGNSIDIPDEYEIIFQDADIKNSKLIRPGKVSKNSATNQTSQQAAAKYLENKVNYDKESRNWNVSAGMSIAQLLDLVLRTSSYITRQQDIYIDEKTGEPVGADNPNGQTRSVPTVQWYRIKTQLKPLGYDSKRRTVAYKITYLINKYQINTPRSPYFPPAEYRGVHKLYNYWFTGQNTEVLDFEIDVNSNYYMVIGNDGRVDQRDDGKFPVTQAPGGPPGQSLQGGERGSTIPAANLSDRLYNAADVASGTIKIVGDPDWIQQTELVYNKNLSLSSFAPDGSVNYDSSEVLFELRFNPVQDYDLQTGLTNVYENNREINLQSKNGAITQSNVAQESLVWAATTVTSTFANGEFTQRLQGVYRDFNSSKNAPVNPQAQVVLSNGQTVEQSLAKIEQDDEPTGAIVGGVRTDAGGGSNRAKAQAQRNNLNSGTPKTGVTTVTSSASRGNVTGGRSAAARRRTITAPQNQFPDDDAGDIPLSP